MESQRRRNTLRSFLLGGLVGGAAGLAAGGRMKVRRGAAQRPLRGLAAFEQAPCYEEIAEREQAGATAPLREVRPAG